MTQPGRLFAVDAEGFLRASYPASVPAAGLAADLQKLGRREAPVWRELVPHLPHAAMTLLGSIVLLWIWLATSPRRARRRGPPPLAN